MRFVRWFDVRHGKRKTKKGRKGKRRDFLKLHFIVDCTSLLILSFKVTPPFKSDPKQVKYISFRSSRRILEDYALTRLISRERFAT